MSTSANVIVESGWEREVRVRHFRDLVFEQTSTDSNWEACKEKWLTPENVAWLERKAKQAGGGQ